MKKWTFLLATILALATTELAQARVGVAVVRQRVVVARSRVVVAPLVARQAFVAPVVVRQQFVAPVALGFTANYGVQQVVAPVQAVTDGCGVQTFAAPVHGTQAIVTPVVQPLILRSRIVGIGY